MNETKTLFTTISNADFGFSEIFLTDRGSRHITRGHRDIASLPMLLIKSAVENATQVFDTHMDNRLMFVSSNVTNSSGRPMGIVIERIDATIEGTPKGKVITATWRDNTETNYRVLWTATSNLYTDFDNESNILYISIGPSIESYAKENNDNPDFWYRYADRDDAHTGITIFRATCKTLQQILLISSEFLGISEEQIKDRLDKLSIIPS